VTRPFISVVMIARDEEDNIERCFSSWWDSVDEVVLCDTGSVDRTVNKAVAFAKRRGAPRKLKIARYEWADDFGAARAYADTVATGQWVTWVDLDDEVRGMDRLRKTAAEASPDIQGFYVRYRCAADEHGNVLSEMWRARLVRAGVGQWHYPVHETLRIGGGTVAKVDPEVCEWLHHGSTLVSERNLRILQAWNDREPGDPLIAANIGIELLGLGRTADAVEAFRGFLALPHGLPEIRARISRQLCTGLQKLGDVAGAKEAGLAALGENPLSADAYLTLAECAHSEGEWQRAYDCANRAMELGKPETMLPVNPSEYVLHPKAIMASSSYALGDVERAIRLAGEVLEASRPESSTIP
jgi:tetratricopeptide (TPR) repeat protein